MIDILKSIKTVYTKFSYQLIAGVIFMLLLAVNYYVLTISASWNDLWLNNSSVYNVFQITTSIIISFLSAISLGMFVYILRLQQATSGFNIFNSLFAILISTASTGCYVCGAVLIPSVGTVLSIGSLPFGGIEVKLIGIILIIFSISQYSKSILGKCKVNNERLISVMNGKLIINKNLKLILNYSNYFVLLLIILAIYFVFPLVASFFKVDFTSSSASAAGKYSCSSQSHK